MRATRRQIDFHGFAEVSEELDRLHALGYIRAGRWDLAQMCEHLSAFMEMSLTGFTFDFPWVLRALGPTVLRRMTLWKRSLPQGFRAPSELAPPSELSEIAAMAVLKGMLDRVREARSFEPSPLFGRMTPEEWRQIHLIHCAHHLSFLVPKVEVARPVAVGHELSAG